MKHVLSIDALGQFPQIIISKSAYNSLKEARKILLNGFNIEEKYEVLIVNYLDFEKKLLDHSAQFMICMPQVYHDFFTVRMDLNIKLANVLMGARLYRDQLQHHVAAVISCEGISDNSAKDLFSKEYDTNIDFRFMEALRNHVQHRELPVHWIQFSCSRREPGSEREPAFSIELASEKQYFHEDKTFKKSVLKEIPERVDLKKAVRSYVEGFSRVHCAVRAITAQPLLDARSRVEEARAAYQEVHQDHCTGLHAICMDGGETVDSVPLLLDWDDVRAGLATKNSGLPNLTSRYVSSRIAM